MSFDIGIFFEYKNQVIQLPVNPEEITVTVSGNNETVEVISLGEINRIKNRKLKDISFESFFPYDTWFPAIRTKGDFRRPEFYKEFFEKPLNNRDPVYLTITGIDIDMYVSIEDFEYSHKAGEHEDAYYSLELKEYVFHRINDITDSQTTASGGQTTTSGGQTTTNNSPQTTEVVGSITPTQVTIGCDVVLNGTVHYDSYGSKPGKTFSNYKGKVNFINKKGSHPYHVTTPSGGWLGWVLESAIEVV